MMPSSFAIPYMMDVAISDIILLPTLQILGPVDEMLRVKCLIGGRWMQNLLFWKLTSANEIGAKLRSETSS